MVEVDFYHLVQILPTALGPTETPALDLFLERLSQNYNPISLPDFLVLNRKFVVVCYLLSDGDGLLGVNHYFTHLVYFDDFGVTIGLKIINRFTHLYFHLKRGSFKGTARFLD